MSCWTTPEMLGNGQGSISSVDIYGIISSSLFGRILTDDDTSRVVLGLAGLLIFSAFLAREITVDSIKINKTSLDYRINRTAIRLLIQ